MNGNRGRMAVTALTLVALGAACDDGGVDGDTQQVGVAFAAHVGTGLAGSIQLAPPITDGIHTLDLTGATVNLDEVVLERSEDEVDTDSDSEGEDGNQTGGDSDSGADSDSDGAGNESVTTGPVSVELQLDGNVVTAISTQVPSGRYEEIELDIASVRLVGTFDTAPFDVTVPLDLELETEFDPPFDVQEQFSLTVAIDVGAWLREADGSVIDPRLLATDEAMRNRLMQRIALSLDAFEDSDKDGDESDSDSDEGEEEDDD